MKKALLVAAALAALLTVTAIVGAALQWWWLVTAAGMTLLSATFLAAFDSDRRVRALRPFVKQTVSTVAAGDVGSVQAPRLAEVDVVGAVQLLQAQYTGRLDRMQESVDQAVAHLRAEGDAARSSATDQSA